MTWFNFYNSVGRRSVVNVSALESFTEITGFKLITSIRIKVLMLADFS